MNGLLACCCTHTIRMETLSICIEATRTALAARSRGHLVVGAGERERGWSGSRIKGPSGRGDAVGHYDDDISPEYLSKTEHEKDRRNGTRG